ncbi:MAG: isoprenylcysteine carboxyl methyltransferase [Bdellovibrionaceae bacterium]|nr:isoprenylcysteine carboxyl methyltransferase [Pseudobdellovibrionaceae bacterium]
MHGEQQYGYGLWTLVVLNTAIFVIFAFSFTKPKTKTDWRSFGAFSAFMLALFTEMYGFPLTIYFLSGWLGQKFPGLNLFSHNNGHLWEAFLGSNINPHFHPIHISANILIVLGFWILASAWKVLHAAQQNHSLAVTGIYSKIRHPQYIGFIAIMFGFLLMWPTLLTLIMFPVLLFMYYRLARKEEKDMENEFGDKYRQYSKKTPRFIPHFKELVNERSKI